jgi:hypothetical protein
MSDFEFKVSNVFPGTVNQKKFGIMATFALDVIVGGTTICRAKDLKIQKSKMGTTFISSASREYIDSKTNEKRYIPYFQLFPDERDGKSSRAIIEQVKRDCENYTTNSDRASNSVPAKPVSKPGPKAETTTDASW